MIRGVDCSSCVFWELQPFLKFGDDQMGQCRAHSPTVIVNAEGKARTNWPITKESDACGDHAAIEVAA